MGPATTSVSELCYLSASELGELIRRGRVSSREIVQAAVDRASATSEVNGIAVPLFDEALEAADKADAVIRRGERLGPLHGIPLTIKDGVATKGHPNTFGALANANDVATSDDVVWQRLRDAGAILLAKSTTSEYFHKVTTDSQLYGVTRNPWALDYSPGGSSGGAAACLSAGIGTLAIGSDGGGSLRWPASCTATFAIKPTMGRVPHVNFGDTFGNYSVLGPMARSAGDLGLLLNVIAGSASTDAASIGRDRPVPLSNRGDTLRVGVVSLDGIDPQVEKCIASGLQGLALQGVALTPFDGSFLDGSYDIYRVISSVGHAARASFTTTDNQAKWSDSFAAVVKEGLGYAANAYHAAITARTRLFRTVQSLFDAIDVIAMPVFSVPCLRIDDESSVGLEAYGKAAATLYPFNLTGHPAISVPVGFTEQGLPVGLQLVGPWYSESRLIAMAELLEQPWLWRRRRPLL